MMMTTAVNRDRISWSEIAQHNHRSSCWIVIQGKVYNLTNFMDEVSTPGRSRARKPDVFFRVCACAFPPNFPRACAYSLITRRMLCIMGRA